jgi:cytochrome P450
LTFDNVFDLKYYNQCFQESLRIEPVVKASSSIMLLEDMKITDFLIKKDTPIQIDMLGLHHNPTEWIEPRRFIPDRFDPNSPYYLTPTGQKRHPMSFAPFLGGKRICLGKTFVELISKIVGPSLVNLLDFEFLDPKLMKEKPCNNIGVVKQPVAIVKVVESNEYQ